MRFNKKIENYQDNYQNMQNNKGPMLPNKQSWKNAQD